MLRSAFSGRELVKETPVAFGSRRSKSFGAACGVTARSHEVMQVADSNVQRLRAATTVRLPADTRPAADFLLRTTGNSRCYFAGVKRIAWPPPGARRTLRFVLESTFLFEIDTASGFVAQF